MFFKYTAEEAKKLKLFEVFNANSITDRLDTKKHIYLGTVKAFNSIRAMDKGVVKFNISYAAIYIKQVK